MLDPWAMRNAAWKKRIAMALYEKRNLEAASCLHALNVAEAASIRAIGLTNPIAIIPNGVELPQDSQVLARPKFLNGDDRKLLLFLGRIHPKKGIAETVEAWSHVLRARSAIGRDWALVIAGWDDGDHLRKIETRAAELGLKGHVYFPGPQFGADKDSAMTHASAFILASYSEGLPMAVLEAWAHRVPVFMTQACNLPEGFDTGAAIEISTEPVAIAQSLLEHLDDPDLPKMGGIGRALVENRFTWNRVGSEMAAVHQWLLNGGFRPSSIQPL
jgi:poly(glycerol-phosphate) alpha-glucosyltransferase